jgi:hypothetical protein
MPWNQDPDIIPRHIALLGINDGKSPEGLGQKRKHGSKIIDQPLTKNNDESTLFLWRKPINTLLMPDFVSAETFEKRMDAARETFFNCEFRTSKVKQFIGYIIPEV